MKTIFKTRQISLYLVLLLIILSCTNENEIRTETEQLSLSSKVDNKTRESLNISNIMKIEKDNQIAINFISELEKEGININKLNLDNINTISFSNSKISIFSISENNSKSKLMAIEYDGKYTLLKSNLVENFNEIRTIDGNIFLKLTKDEKGLITRSFLDNEAISKFSNYVYTKNQLKHKNSTSHKTATCCRNYDYVGCMQCTVPSHLVIIFAWLAPEIDLAIAISCIGAGPDAWC
jgi:hypothetical protein